MINSRLVKTIQNIMRQDDGVDGDAQSLSQLVWMIFLKVLDDSEKELQALDPRYVPAVPANLQWRSWAASDEGLTGEPLVRFVNDDLFPSLRSLSIKASNSRTSLVKSAFQDSYNFMKSGVLLRQVLNKINEVDFNASTDRHQFNEMYEKLLKNLQGAGSAGEYYTPRAITEFIVERVSPSLGELVLDPACGTGGFLTHTIDFLRHQVQTTADERVLQESVLGVEKKPLPHVLCLTNMILHGIDVPTNIRRDNTLTRPLRDYGPSDQVDVILTNPPFGGVEEPGIENNFPSRVRSRETAELFLVLIMRLLKPGGRAGIVLPQGVLFGSGAATTEIKRQLLNEFDLHTVIRLPESVFAPYTDIATNLLFFTKGTKTETVWYYEHPLPAGVKAFNKGRPIKVEDFEEVRHWWINRQSTERSWSVSYQELEQRNFDLDVRNPNAVRIDDLHPEEVMKQFLAKKATSEQLLRRIAAGLETALKES